MTTKTLCAVCNGTKWTRTDRRTACSLCKRKCCDKCVTVRGRGKTRASLCTDCNRSH